MNTSLSILGFGHVRAPGVDAGAPKLDLRLLERTLRRGLSDVTRLFMHAAHLALDSAKLTPSDVQVIFASAFGEIAAAEALLAEAHDADGSSPARFRHSVHNTATGLLSISAKSRVPCTALAAGWDTVAMALLEASALLAAPQPGDPERVLVVFSEEKVPHTLASEHDHPALAAAFVLARGDHPAALGMLTRLRRAPAREADLGPPGEPLGHPLAPAVTLSEALSQHRSGTLRVGDGDDPWCVDVDAREAR
ncbi:MAG: beta-ketoacyl synthase chain length factor [Polyangiales bacterium]